MPSLLDTLIGWLSPHTALRRARARLALRMYEGASKSERLSGWRAASTSAQTEIMPALRTLRDRCRDLRRNNPWAARGVSLIANNVIVYGMACSLTGNKRRVQRVTPALQAWADTTACDAEGQNNLAGLQALALAAVVEAGEVLIRRRMRRPSDGLPVPMQLQVIEADYLVETKTESLPNGGKILNGIEYDAIGRRVAYWLYRDHPGDGLTPRMRTDMSRVPAEDIAHIYRIDRPGQQRGVPWLAPVMITIRTLDEYEDAQLVRQKIAACFAGTLTTPDAESDVDEAAKWAGRMIEPGTINVAPPGTELNFSNPPSAEGYAPYTATQLRRLAAGLGVPYEALTCDLSQVNFSSARMGWQEFARNIESWRWQMLVPQGLDRIGAWFIEAATLAGYDTAGLGMQWTAPSRTLVDPARETQPIIDQVRAGLISPQEAIRERGYDPDTVLADWRAFADKLDELGLVLDIDPRVDVRKAAAKQPQQDTTTP